MSSRTPLSPIQVPLGGISPKTLADIDAHVKAVLQNVASPIAASPLSDEGRSRGAWLPYTPESASSEHSAYSDRYQPANYSADSPDFSFKGFPTQDESSNSPSEMFEHKLDVLANSLQAVEARSEMLAARVEASETESEIYAERLAESEKALGQVVLDGRKKEMALEDEVARLHGAMEAQQLATEVAEETLRQMVSRERREADHLRLERDEAIRQRAEALIELNDAAADLEAMQATLTDSAAYCRYLRDRCSELEHQAAALSESQSRKSDAFGLEKTKEAIQNAVAQMTLLSEGDRKKQLRQLQLRWHPDKNPVLKEFATEVSKLINEAATELERNLSLT